MKKIALLLVGLVLMMGTSLRADEGMWLLPLIEKLNIQKMQEMGLQLSAEQIYSVNNTSLKDAIVIFGRGCTGELISEQGLVLTNHHCGYGSIQQHSTTQHDYLKDGFWAMSFEEEIPTPGLTVTFLVRIEDVTEKMNATIKAVKDMGVEDKDVQTTTYSLSPLYNYTEAAGRIFQGYILEQDVQVKIRDFEKVGEILQKATSAGANLTGNLQFTIDDPEQFKQEARAKAIEQAKSNAENLAQTSGIKLGKIINVYENYSYPVAYDSYSKLGMGGGISETAVPSPIIQPGQQEIEITINLTYQVK